MELMSTCLDKLMKRLGGPIPEPILGKISVAVSVHVTHVTIRGFEHESHTGIQSVAS